MKYKYGNFKEGQYVVRLQRKDANGFPYEGADQGYLVTLKDIKFFEKYLKEQGFEVDNSIVGIRPEWWNA